MIRYSAVFIIMALHLLANAADGSSTKSIINSFTVPTFYEEHIVKQRDGAAQTPVNLETPVDSNYIVGPGDFFEILLPNGLEGLQVSPEGTLAIQGCGFVEVSGLKLSEAKRKILEKLKTRYDQRFTGVHLVQLRRFVVSVQGAVNNPGQVTVSGQTRVKGAIYSAGNFKPWAEKDSVHIYRMGDTLITSENVLLQVGDIIEVPHREWHQTVDLMYSGNIITVPYVPGRTLKEYAKEVGVNIENGYGAISVKYLDGFVRWIGMEQIGYFVPEPLHEVEFHIQAPFVYVGGAVAAVGKVPYNPSMSPADYVAASGATIITGDFSRISVIRNGKRVSVDWANGEILPGDFIDIPRTAYELTKDVTFFVTSILGIVGTVLTIYMALNN